MFVILQVNIGESLFVFMRYDCYISFGHNPKSIIPVLQDVKAKLFHDRNADDVNNSVVNPGVKFFARNGLSKFALEVGYGHTRIAVAMQVSIALASDTRLLSVTCMKVEQLSR